MEPNGTSWNLPIRWVVIIFPRHFSPWKMARSLPCRHRFRVAMVREAGGGVHSFRITCGSYGLITNIWQYDNDIWEYYTGWWMVFSIYWEFHHPNWLIFFQRGWNNQPVYFISYGNILHDNDPHVTYSRDIVERDFSHLFTIPLQLKGTLQLFITIVR